MGDAAPSTFTNTVPTNKDTDFFPYTKNKTTIPLDVTISFQQLINSISLLTTITDVNSDVNDLMLLKQASDNTAKVLTIDNFFKGIHDLVIPASAFDLPLTEPASGGFTQVEFGATGHKQTKRVMNFISTSTNERIQVEFPMPRKWNLGAFDVVIVWSHGDGTGDVRWGSRAVCAGDNDAIAPNFGTAVEDDFTNGTDDDYIYSVLSAVTPGGTPASADILTLEIYRKGSDEGDTFDDTARLHHVILRPTINKKADG